MLLSHTGVYSQCNSVRNADDDLIRRVAAANGLIGVTMFRPALCGPDIIVSFAQTVRRAVDAINNHSGPGEAGGGNAGVNALALGSDWDGFVETAVSSDRTDVLAAALRDTAGFSHDEVARIMYGNARRFLEANLPSVS